ncbi:putative purine permease 11 [Silene latifolia]|uniref:putative purine permease 11 n=1 Tax=Silene latifolia TaxID=37657 RepID=UPI003D7854ED
MYATQEFTQQTKGSKEDDCQKTLTPHNIHFHMPKLVHYKWWLRVMSYIIFLLVGQTAATLLGRLYYDKGGNSTWIATFVQSAGFPILIPLLYFFPKPAIASSISPPLWKLAPLYFALGLMNTGFNLMYSYGLLYLSVSTYSLLCATQLGFNAVFSFFLNAQKFTAPLLNSLVLLTISACLLATNANNEESETNHSRKKYIIGFMCTIAASASYSLYLSLVQLSFEKVIKDESFNTVVAMLIYPSIVATLASAAGLFISGEWSTLDDEMKVYETGKVSYIMTLMWTAITWQTSYVGLLGLIFEVSSLFSNVISTLVSPLVPVFAVIFFHDKMNGVKINSLLLAIWGFLSYIYQQYLDDAKANKTKISHPSETPTPNTKEIC